VKALIQLRRSNVCFNDGDMHHLSVSSDEQRQILEMCRDEARVMINFGEQPYRFDLLQEEELKLCSREGVSVCDGGIDLPPMTFAVLMSPTSAVEDRQVEAHQ
jgi:maltooligosyltrehalose trehalohydrolase